jgi:predicted transcriptional regulator
MAQTTRSDVVLLALHPIHANAILEGRKTAEFRRSKIPADAKRVVIYATAPIMQVLGYATVAGFKQASPATIWRNYREQGNVTKAFFDDYFTGAPQARCYLLKSPKRFKTALSLEVFGVSAPPQSFVYVRSLKVSVRKLLAISSGR